MSVRVSSQTPSQISDAVREWSGVYGEETLITWLRGYIRDLAERKPSREDIQDAWRNFELYASRLGIPASERLKINDLQNFMRDFGVRFVDAPPSPEDVISDSILDLVRALAGHITDTGGVSQADANNLLVSLDRLKTRPGKTTKTRPAPAGREPTKRPTATVAPSSRVVSRPVTVAKTKAPKVAPTTRPTRPPTTRPVIPPTTRPVIPPTTIPATTIPPTTIPPATPTIPSATPTIPPATPTIPSATPTIPPATPTIPSATPTIPPATPTIPHTTPTIPHTTTTTSTPSVPPTFPSGGSSGSGDSSILPAAESTDIPIVTSEPEPDITDTTTGTDTGIDTTVIPTTAPGPEPDIVDTSPTDIPVTTTGPEPADVIDTSSTTSTGGGDTPADTTGTATPTPPPRDVKALAMLANDDEVLKLVLDPTLIAVAQEESAQLVREVAEIRAKTGALEKSLRFTRKVLAANRASTSSSGDSSAQQKIAETRSEITLEKAAVLKRQIKFLDEEGDYKQSMVGKKEEQIDLALKILSDDVPEDAIVYDATEFGSGNWSEIVANAKDRYENAKIRYERALGRLPAKLAEKRAKLVEYNKQNFGGYGLADTGRTNSAGTRIFTDLGYNQYYLVGDGGEILFDDEGDPMRVTATGVRIKSLPGKDGIFLDYFVADDGVTKLTDSSGDPITTLNMRTAVSDIPGLAETPEEKLESRERDFVLFSEKAPRTERVRHPVGTVVGKTSFGADVISDGGSWYHINEVADDGSTVALRTDVLGRVIADANPENKNPTTLTGDDGKRVKNKNGFPVLTNANGEILEIAPSNANLPARIGPDGVPEDFRYVYHLLDNATAKPLAVGGKLVYSAYGTYADINKPFMEDDQGRMYRVNLDTKLPSEKTPGSGDRIYVDRQGIELDPAIYPDGHFAHPVRDTTTTKSPIPAIPSEIMDRITDTEVRELVASPENLQKEKEVLEKLEEELVKLDEPITDAYELIRSLKREIPDYENTSNTARDPAERVAAKHAYEMNKIALGAQEAEMPYLIAQKDLKTVAAAVEESKLNLAEKALDPAASASEIQALQYRLTWNKDLLSRQEAAFAKASSDYEAASQEFERQAQEYVQAKEEYYTKDINNYGVMKTGVKDPLGRDIVKMLRADKYYLIGSDGKLAFDSDGDPIRVTSIGRPIRLVPPISGGDRKRIELLSPRGDNPLFDPRTHAPIIIDQKDRDAMKRYIISDAEKKVLAEREFKQLASGATTQSVPFVPPIRGDTGVMSSFGPVFSRGDLSYYVIDGYPLRGGREIPTDAAGRIIVERGNPMSTDPALKVHYVLQGEMPDPSDPHKKIYKEESSLVTNNGEMAHIAPFLKVGSRQLAGGKLSERKPVYYLVDSMTQLPLTVRGKAIFINPDTYLQYTEDDEGRFYKINSTTKQPVLSRGKNIYVDRSGRPLDPAKYPEGYWNHYGPGIPAPTDGSSSSSSNIGSEYSSVQVHAICDECGEDFSDPKLYLPVACPCGGKKYCSRGCQSHDWRTTHNRECDNKPRCDQCKSVIVLARNTAAVSCPCLKRKYCSGKCQSLDWRASHGRKCTTLRML